MWEVMIELKNKSLAWFRLSFCIKPGTFQTHLNFIELEISATNLECVRTIKYQKYFTMYSRGRKLLLCHECALVSHVSYCFNCQNYSLYLVTRLVYIITVQLSFTKQRLSTVEPRQWLHLYILLFRVLSTIC